RGAIAFLFPSFYEGFGIPSLEAMAMGCRVLTSDRGAMKEVAGEAAYLVDPLSVESIAEGLRKLESDSELRSNLKIKGLDRVSQFTWNAAAERLYGVYKNL
ncbi:MAG: glycosyltransferase, partial [Bdellovibrionales bacterium]|nr:glycosyltransferase [Bdellovibrionales bacterium]NQZ20132.1 glycosyltransferase [Bdellovibrionales bacterium]